ncbi:Oidioi.mRNA.OKI2018_I69.chr1.g744.t1.cds [Oikopleura dioica]|uniref:Oidioi.mRNA.OKI2018_I69.chr1.g744.t1.cds n=1 Tax=Oikopleura dioica TaxID=34765 RepID=A0ABN7SMI1_OIKDI|nr:Oidioi.mRNA.OKI2018_I69.chr1.g744.t1.cds [Oikopleura dioica]
MKNFLIFSVFAGISQAMFPRSPTRGDAGNFNPWNYVYEDGMSDSLMNDYGDSDPMRSSSKFKPYMNFLET